MSTQGKHLTRLDRVWVPSPLYLITACTDERAPRLACPEFHAIATEVWTTCSRLYGWATGRYVIMPDHVHFFATDVREDQALSTSVGKWKEWTAKYAVRRLNWAAPLWQPEFFDHLIRSAESYDQKWEYVRANPVRAGLVTSSDEWPYQGELSTLRCN